MKISEIFPLMLASGLAKSQVEFSTIWLGRSARYYSQLIATGREPSVGALLGLSSRLRRLAGLMPSLKAKPLLELVQVLEQHCERREILVVRRHRRRAH